MGCRKRKSHLRTFKAVASTRSTEKKLAAREYPLCASSSLKSHESGNALTSVAKGVTHSSTKKLVLSSPILIRHSQCQIIRWLCAKRSSCQEKKPSPQMGKLSFGNHVFPLTFILVAPSGMHQCSTAWSERYENQCLGRENTTAGIECISDITGD